MSPTRYAGIGLDLGVGHLTAVAVDCGGRQILTWHRSYPPQGTAPGPVAGMVDRAGVVNAGVALRAGEDGGDEPGHLTSAAVPLDPTTTAGACEGVQYLATASGLCTLLLRTRLDWRDAPAEPHLEVADLVRRAAAGDQQVMAALAEFGRWLGYTTGTLANVFDPEIVLLGGYHAALAPWSLPAAKQAA